MAPVTVRVAAPRRHTDDEKVRPMGMLRRHRAAREGRQTTSANTTPEAAPLTADEVAALKGAALADALEAAGLPKTGTADEKRAALAAHYAQGDEPADEPTEPDEDADDEPADEPDEDDEPEADEDADEDADE